MTIMLSAIGSTIVMFLGPFLHVFDDGTPFGR